MSLINAKGISIITSPEYSKKNLKFKTNILHMKGTVTEVQRESN